MVVIPAVYLRVVVIPAVYLRVWDMQHGVPQGEETCSTVYLRVM